MRTLTTSLLGLSLLLSSAAPALAQIAPTSDLARIQSCRVAAARDYRASLTEALNAMRKSVSTEWARQVNFRVNAATSAQQRSVRTRLETSGRTYASTLSSFQSAQLRGVDADINTAIGLYTRLDGTAEETALENWVNRDVSLTPVETTLATMLRRLFVYANARDRQVITGVWNDFRQNTEDGFNQARSQARDIFVNDMDECLVPAMVTEPAEGDSSDTNDNASKPQEAPAAAPQQPATPAAEKPSAPTTNNQPVQISTVSAYAISSEYVMSCRNTFMVKGMITATGSGSVKYQWTTSDGRTSNPEYLTFAGSETKTVVLSWPIEGSFNGSFQLKVWEPIQMASNQVFVKQTCANTQAAAPETTKPAEQSSTPNTNDNSGTVSVLSVRGEISPSYMDSCVNRFSATGYIKTSKPATVQYYWRYGNTQTDKQTVTTDAYGQATVTGSWSPDTSRTSLVQEQAYLVIVSPSSFTSEAIGYSYKCPSSSSQAAATPTDKPAAPAATHVTSISLKAIGAASVNSCGPNNSTFGFQATINGENLQTVTYRWEHDNSSSSYTDSANQTSSADSSSISFLQSSWTTNSSASSNRVRLHILTPTDITSDYLSLSAICAQ